MPWELLDSRKRPWKSKVACRREKPLWVSSRKKTRNLETCKNQTHRLSARTARLTLLRRDLAISGRCGFCCCCCSSSSNERRFRDLMKQGKKKRKVSKVIRVRFFLSQKKVERKKKTPSFDDQLVSLSLSSPAPAPSILRNPIKRCALGRLRPGRASRSRPATRGALEREEKRFGVCRRVFFSLFFFSHRRRLSSSSSLFSFLSARPAPSFPRSLPQARRASTKSTRDQTAEHRN
jgi:hypothetical protein